MLTLPGESVTDGDNVGRDCMGMELDCADGVGRHGDNGTGCDYICLPVMAMPISTVNLECLKPGRQALMTSKQRKGTQGTQCTGSTLGTAAERGVEGAASVSCAAAALRCSCCVPACPLPALRIACATASCKNEHGREVRRSRASRPLCCVQPHSAATGHPLQLHQHGVQTGPTGLPNYRVCRFVCTRTLLAPPLCLARAPGHPICLPFCCSGAGSVKRVTSALQQRSRRRFRSVVRLECCCRLLLLLLCGAAAATREAGTCRTRPQQA